MGRLSNLKHRINIKHDAVLKSELQLRIYWCFFPLVPVAVYSGRCDPVWSSRSPLSLARNLSTVVHPQLEEEEEEEEEEMEEEVNL